MWAEAIRAERCHSLSTNRQTPSVWNALSILAGCLKRNGKGEIPTSLFDRLRTSSSASYEGQVDAKWLSFLRSDPCNEKIFQLRGNKLSYRSEHLIPEKTDSRPPQLKGHHMDATMLENGKGVRCRNWCAAFI